MYFIIDFFIECFNCLVIYRIDDYCVYEYGNVGIDNYVYCGDGIYYCIVFVIC